MVETDLAYAAGIIDGEGCIRLHKHKSIMPFHNNGRGYYYRIVVNVANTVEWLPNWLALTFGGSVCKQRKLNPLWKTTWQWTISAKKAVKFLALILPYLRLKKFQAEICLSYAQRQKERKTRNRTEAQNALDEADAILMTNLNRKGKPK